MSHTHQVTVSGKKLTTTSATDAAIADLTARVVALEAKAGDIPGWRSVFSDDFTTWDPSRYFVYPTTWLDTSKNGYRNSPGGITSDGTKLRCHLFSANGMAYGAHFIPLIAGGGAYGNAMALRVEIRMRADRMPGFKCADLLWPDSTVYPNWPEGGEADAPEGNFDGSRPSVFLHSQSNNQQKWWPYPQPISLQDWHTYVTEWVGGQSFRAYIDGVKVAEDTDPTFVPKGPMHYVFQNETNLDTGYPKPDPAVQGYVEVEYLRLWVPA